MISLPLQLDLKFFGNSLEMALVSLVDLKGLPSIVTQQHNRNPSMRLLMVELFNSAIGHSIFTKEAMFLEVMKRFNGLIASGNMERYREEVKKLKTHLNVSKWMSRCALWLPCNPFYSNCWALAESSSYPPSIPAPCASTPR